jgi:hypothetical protein
MSSREIRYTQIQDKERLEKAHGDEWVGGIGVNVHGRVHEQVYRGLCARVSLSL